jgi:hypothetical protein
VVLLLRFAHGAASSYLSQWRWWRRRVRNAIKSCNTQMKLEINLIEPTLITRRWKTVSTFVNENKPSDLMHEADCARSPKLHLPQFRFKHRHRNKLLSNYSIPSKTGKSKEECVGKKFAAREREQRDKCFNLVRTGVIYFCSGAADCCRAVT